MATDIETQQQINTALAACQTGRLTHRALALFGALGYRSEMRVDLDTPTAAGFLKQFDRDNTVNHENALINRWRSVDLVFQLTDAEIHTSNQMRIAFDAGATFDAAIYDSFVFFALELADGEYTRTQLAAITREINKLFTMPVSILFRYGALMTLSIVTHRPNKRDSGRDVLEKVTLIKDIDTTNPHRAHVEILFDLSLAQLHAASNFRNFDELQHAWKTTLDSSELNKRFFKELANWYFWAADQVEFPADIEPRRGVRNATGVIRLITRLMFVWFLKEKGLIPGDLFNRGKLNNLLTTLEPQESSYYKAVLQNLFFATLNTEMSDAKMPRPAGSGSRGGRC